MFIVTYQDWTQHNISGGIYCWKVSDNFGTIEEARAFAESLETVATVVSGDPHFEARNVKVSRIIDRDDDKLYV